MTKHFLPRLAILILLIGQAPLGVLAQNPPAAAGHWEGQIEVPSLKLDILVDLAQKEGAWTGTIAVPAQGLKDFALGQITVEDKQISFVMPGVPGDPSFSGRLAEDGKAISGNFTQGGQTFPFKLERKLASESGKAVEFARPQEPKKPYPYLEEEVAYENKEAGVTLAGTLTLPRSQGPFPAVLLVTGSGPQDRNETVLGHRPFLVLADYLTRLGIAVLRVDDRGVGKSTGNFREATSQDFAGDALAGVEFLKSRKEINNHRIGILGHSEGGIIAPIVAVKSADVAFIILMAGPGITGEEILYLQGELIAKANGASDEVVARSRQAQEKIFSVMKQEKDLKVAEKKIREKTLADMATMTEEEKKKMGISESSLENNLKTLLTPWFQYFLTYDPRPTLMKVKCPVLAINGAKDLQVPPSANLPAISKALEDGGNNDYTLVKLPNLNHLFQTSKTGSPVEYSSIEETISPLALKVIGDWIQAHTKG